MQRSASFFPFLFIGGFDSSALCRSRRELSNAYLLAKFGLHTAENEPCQVCPTPRNAAASERSVWPDRGEPGPTVARGRGVVAPAPRARRGVPPAPQPAGRVLTNLTGLVLGCIEVKFCKKICVRKLSPRSTRCTPLHCSKITFFASIQPRTSPVKCARSSNAAA